MVCHDLRMGKMRKALSLFQVLLSNIAYNVIVKIIYLILLIAVVLIKAILPVVLLKYIIAACVFFIMHILFVLLESVAQMPPLYYLFPTAGISPRRRAFFIRKSDYY